MVNINNKIFGKVLFNCKWHENIDLVNTYLFFQVCKVHDIVCLGDRFANI